MTPVSTIRLLIFTIFTLSWCTLSVEAVKVLDINENLLDLIEKHNQQNWLVKFYAPWCHHCQQLEPTYNNVAEDIYNKHNNLIVGRVDCTKAGRICEHFGVNSYPTIKFINKDSQVSYRGDRSEKSILAFADRLQGPTVNVVRSCKELGEATNKHDLVILSTIANDNDPVRKEFESLARAYKSTHWFYQYFGDCQDLFQGEGLYLLKRHLNKAIKFEPSQPSEKTVVPPDDTIDLKSAIVDWLNKESFSIYGKISSGNIEKILATGKLLVISILDEYKPVRRFTPTSREFYRRIELLARDYAQSDDELLFGWCSDIELIEFITITPINFTPNVIILKSDFRYHLMLSNDSEIAASSRGEKNLDTVDNQLMEKLSIHSIRTLINQAKTGNLTFNGGNTYLFILWRYVMGNINKFSNMYRANPLLVSVIFGFPSLIIIFVIYTTCFSDGRDEDDDDEGYSDDEYEDDDSNRRLLHGDHLKRD